MKNMAEIMESLNRAMIMKIIVGFDFDHSEDHTDMDDFVGYDDEDFADNYEE